MKQYITIAALIAAGAAFASADDEQTISPFLDASNWVNVGQLGKPTINSLNTYKWNQSNPEGYSTYTAFDSIVLDSADDYVTFSYTHKAGTTIASAATLALAGSEGAIVIGHSYSEAIGYGISMTPDADNYTFTGTDWGDEILSATAVNNKLTPNRSYNIEGSISWDTKLSTFVLNIALTEPISNVPTTFTSGSVALGDEFSIERLIIAVDAARTSQVTFSNLALTWGHVAVPEPSAFGLLAGLGALALVGTRRRRR